MRKPRIAVLTDLSGPLNSAAIELEKLDYKGVIEVVPHCGLGSELSEEFLRDVDGVLTRPGSPSLRPEHLKWARRPFVVATISVGTSHLEGLLGMDGVKLVAPTGTNAAGTASIALSLADLLLRPVHIGCQQMASGVFDRTVFNGSRRPEGLHWLAVGAGHVVRAMLWELLSRSPGQITVFNRTMESRESVLSRMSFLLSDIPAGCRSSSLDPIDGGYSTMLVGRGNEQIPFRFVCGDFAAEHTVIPGLSDADVVSIHLPVTESTRGFFGPKLIEQMKRGSCVVNVARGELVDEEAIVQTLAGGHLGGYAADVVFSDAENERQHTLSPVWNRYVTDQYLPAEQRLKILLTPHIGGHVFPDLEQTAASAISGMLGALGVSVV
jgi:phosphoglycerate dehydrogenase-like enzyme